MAIIVHQTSKNARYSDALEYYSYKHEESQKTGHYEPILDDYGLLQERDNFAVTYITAQGEEADPERWAAACLQTNQRYGKNQDANDRKSHEYIISHPESDRQRMTMDDLIEEGKAFVRNNFQGYDCLIAVHRDTDNDHIHISLNSVRALQRAEQPWMMRDKGGQILACEMEAGGKHQNSPALQQHLNDWLLDYTRDKGLEVEDNNQKATENRKKRHGSKNDEMKAALLDTAGRSKDINELKQKLKDEYHMELNIRGSTLSIQHPDSQKAVRLRTLGLEPTDITRLLSSDDYAYTTAVEEQQIQKEIEAEEKKKYIEWIRQRRQKNNEKAEDTILRCEWLLAEGLRTKGDKYNKHEFRDLNYLIKQTAYLDAALQTELDKVDQLLGRWMQYQDTSLSDRERRQHAGYVRWCGCDPDSALELEDLLAEREVIVAQIAHVEAMHVDLTDEAEKWKGRNDLTYSENNLVWTKQREVQLKQQLKNIKKSQKKLWEISCNCEQAAYRYGDPARMQKCYHFRQEWAEKVFKQQEIEKKLIEIKQKKKDAKIQVKQARKNAGKMGIDR